jgi:hypothetical protein
VQFAVGRSAVFVLLPALQRPAQMAGAKHHRAHQPAAQVDRGDRFAPQRDERFLQRIMREVVAAEQSTRDAVRVVDVRLQVRAGFAQRMGG